MTCFKKLLLGLGIAFSFLFLKSKNVLMILINILISVIKGRVSKAALKAKFEYFENRM